MTTPTGAPLVITCRVQTPLPGWSLDELVTVERTAFVAALLAQGRLTLVEPEPEPAAPVEPVAPVAAAPKRRAPRPRRSAD